MQNSATHTFLYLWPMNIFMTHLSSASNRYNYIKLLIYFRSSVFQNTDAPILLPVDVILSYSDTCIIYYTYPMKVASPNCTG
jgi:hypothetical protein